MASISSLGSGSGLDLSGILKNLMSVEQQPLLALQKKEISYQSKISALGTLKGALSNLQTAAGNLLPSSPQTAADKYTSYSVSVANTSIATATIATSGKPVAGGYSLEVSALAKSQRLASTTSYTRVDDPIAQGTLTIDFGKLDGTTYVADGARKLEIVVNNDNDTLAGLRDSINKANAGVSATIVTGTAGPQLLLSSKDTGNNNVMKLQGLAGFDFDPALGTGSLTQNSAQGGQAASDAEFKLNGISATSSNNVVSGAIDGISIALLKTTEANTPTTITVSRDQTASVTSALNAFVKAYNEASSTLSTLGAYDAKTQAAGALQGQAIVRNTQSQLRNQIFGTVGNPDSDYQRLSNIGITFEKEGTLKLDSSKLNKALSADFSSVMTLVEKIGTNMKTTVESMVSSSGSVTSMTSSTTRLIEGLNKQRTVLNDRLTRIEDRYRAQFTALDTAIASMKQTSTYLTQQLASLSTGR